MIRQWFTSDWHLRHQNMAKLRGFESVEKMDTLIYNHLIEKVQKHDELYVLGDLGWEVPVVEEILKLLKQMKVKVYWVTGNHDKRLPLTKLAPYCVEIQQTRIVRNVDGNGRKFFLSHYPHVVFENSFRDSINLYGHVHKSSKEFLEVEDMMRGQALNVNVELHDYYPLSKEEILEKVSKKEHNWDYVVFQREIEREKNNV